MPVSKTVGTDVALFRSMMLRRRKRKESKMKAYSITALSILILAYEMWYLDSVNNRVTKPSGIVAYREFVANNHLLFASLLIEDEGSGARPHLFKRKNGMLNFGAKFRLGKIRKGGKNEIHKHSRNNSHSTIVHYGKRNSLVCTSRLSDELYPGLSGFMLYW
jgi:hypothetical protein